MNEKLRWFAKRRQEFILSHLRTYGQIRRADIAKEFEVTHQIASGDIARFLDTHPDSLVYDGRAKMYVLHTEELTDV